MAEYRLAQLGQNELADRIRSAIGAGDWEEVQVITPQFDRTDGNVPWWFPKSAADLESIRAAPDDVLRSMGLARWSEEEPALWLFPAEWYDHIPAGYEIVDINGAREPFEPGVTDDDQRFGVLAYGIRRATPTPGGPDAK